MRRTSLSIAVAACALALAAAPAWAGRVDGCHPRCGAPGDLFYVQGADLSDPPVVTLGDRPVAVVRVRAGALLCTVPAGIAEGEAALRVDGAKAPHPFLVLTAGRPAVHGLSAATGTPGQFVFVHGRRLQAGCVAFLDAQGRAVATVDLVGGRRAVLFRVPAALEPGRYALRFTNGDGLATDTSSPRFEVAPHGEPALCAIHPASAPPLRAAIVGEHARCRGTDLGPRGPCLVHWTNAAGERTTARGRANGYDVVRTTVPAGLDPGAPYAVVIELADGGTTPPLAWTPAPAPAPSAAQPVRATAPAGSFVTVRAAGLLAPAHEIRAQLASDEGVVDADLVYRHLGGLGHGAGWIVRLPDDLPEGDYRLTLGAGDRTTQPATMRVAEDPFTVTALQPDGQPASGTDRPIVVEGSGFGPSVAGADLRVVWTDGDHTLEGTLLFCSDRTLSVLPPGTNQDPLSVGSWSVYVVHGRRTDPQVIRAGTYVVTATD